MNEELKRTLFLMSYQPGKDLKVINESVDTLVESRQTEIQALSYFRRAGIEESQAIKLLDQFRSIDRTKNKALTMPMAVAFKQSGDINEISKTFQSVSELINDNKIPYPIVDNSGRFHIGNRAFSSYSGFSSYINDFTKLSGGYQGWKSEIKVDTKSEPIFPRNKQEEKTGIVIYDGNDVGRCVNYGTGGISGEYYKFCISQPGNTNWKTYRDQKGSTFYFVFDKTKDLNDPLHMTVVDRTVNLDKDYGFEVTDADNTTNEIASFGKNILAYIEYLRKRGVPVDEIFVNAPMTKEEEEEHLKLGKPNMNIEWFKSLSFDNQTKYIGRGHTLSDEQFKYLWEHRKNPGGFHLLKQYLNLGIALSEYQFKLLTTDNEASEI